MNTHLLEINRAIGGAGGVAAVGEHTAAEVLAALKAAKKNGATTSFDLNYRHTLWSKEAAQAAMAELMPYIDVIITTEDAYDVMNGGSARVKR